jgi:hypothetical protein
MAIIEVQMRTDRFCELVRGEINSRPLDQPGGPAKLSAIAGKPLERIECKSCSFRAMIDKPIGLGMALDIAQKRLVFDMEWEFEYHDSLANVRNAGSLKPAAITARKEYPFQIEFWISFETKPVRRPVLNFELFALFESVRKEVFPISMPSDAPIVDAAIVADEHVVAIRFGTAAGDDVSGPLVDRLDGHEWIQHVPGSMIADKIRDLLDRALDEAVKKPPPPDPNKPWLPKPKKPQELTKEGPASASWNFALGTGFVSGGGEIVAVDACPLFNVDIPIELTLVVTFEFPSPGTQRTRAVLTWDADSTWCDFLAGLMFGIAGGIPIGIGIGTAFNVGIANEVSDTILGKRLNPGDGLVETGRTDDSITYERLGAAPPPPSPEFEITHGSATSSGLAVGGVIKPKVRAKLVGETVAPTAGIDINCNIRSVSVSLRPAKVLLRTDQPGRLPWFFFEKIVFEPAGAWVIDVGTEIVSPASATPAHVVLTFRDPPGGRLPPGTATSAYLFTNYGVRWADLGIIPVVSPDLLIKFDARKLMNVYCDSIRNPWAGGITKFEWVDPLLDPDYLDRQVELGRLRLWTLGVRDLPEIARVELLAIGPEGRERPLGVIEGRSHVALEVLTEANESLAMRTRRGFNAPAPTLTQSWFYPTADVDMNSGAPEAPAAPLAERIAGEMANQEQRGRLPWATAIRLNRKTLAAPHDGRMVVGTVVRGQRVQ